MKDFNDEIHLGILIYNAVAEVLAHHGIPDERGPNYEDEPSYDIMSAVLEVLRSGR